MTSKLRNATVFGQFTRKYAIKVNNLSIVWSCFAAVGNRRRTILAVFMVGGYEIRCKLSLAANSVLTVHLPISVATRVKRAAALVLHLASAINHECRRKTCLVSNCDSCSAPGNARFNWRILPLAPMCDNLHLKRAAASTGMPATTSARRPCDDGER